VKKTRTPPARAAAPAGGRFRPWTAFWFTPRDPLGLHALRLLTGLLLLAWLLPLAGSAEAFFGLGGWFDQRAYGEAARLPGGPPQPFGWSVLYLCGSNPFLVRTAYWLAVLVVFLFTLGVAARLTAVLAWVVVVSFTANPALAYDADPWLSLLSFYLMLGYVLVGQEERGRPLLWRLLGGRDMWLLGGLAVPSVGANVAVRLLQVHFAVAVVTTGLHKLQFGDWWSGVAFWYPLHPPLETTLAKIRSLAPNARSYLTVLSIGAYATLAWQIAFPTFAWRRRWRWLLLGGAVCGWLGTALLYEMPLVGPVLALGCLSYLTAEEWQAVVEFLTRLPGLGRLRRGAAGDADERAAAGEASPLVAARMS
jgi:hypothetical protein